LEGGKEREEERGGGEDGRLAEREEGQRAAV
jgi:hypothetical protein